MSASIKNSSERLNILGKIKVHENEKFSSVTSLKLKPPTFIKIHSSDFLHDRSGSLNDRCYDMIDKVQNFSKILPH